MRHLVIFVLTAALACGQEKRLCELTYLQSKPGEHERLVKFIEANWFAMDREAVRQGLFVSYQLLEPVSSEGPDVGVLVCYRDEKGYAGVQKEFEEIRRKHKPVLIDGKGLRELGAVVESRQFLERRR